jgi:hypothetical protein
MPAPPNDRNLAEGYRYLAGLRAQRDRARVPSRPALPDVPQRALDPHQGDDRQRRRDLLLRADRRPRVVRRARQVGDHRHWRGDAPAKSGRLAPQYLIFELNDGLLAGDSGSLAELRPGVKVQMGPARLVELEVRADGRFEILIAPERPAGHTGNYICSHKRVSRPPPDEPNGSLDRYACWMQRPPALLRLGARGSDAPLDRARSAGARAPARVHARARRRAAARDGRARARADALLERILHGAARGVRQAPGGHPSRPGERFMPRNAFNQPNAASGATGGGQSTNIYAGGVFELEPDEALIIESRIPVPPQYIGFHLGNLWGESLDYANHQTSLNGRRWSAIPTACCVMSSRTATRACRTGSIRRATARAS